MTTLTPFSPLLPCVDSKRPPRKHNRLPVGHPRLGSRRPSRIGLVLLHDVSLEDGGGCSFGKVAHSRFAEAHPSSGGGRFFMSVSVFFFPLASSVVEIFWWRCFAGR